AGIALGLRAAWREAGAPDLATGHAQSVAGDDALIAKPIVEPPPPVADAEPAKDEDKADATTDKAKSETLAAQTAAAQAIQAKPSQPAGDIDQILTSASEKPPPPAKPAADETPPPGPPVKSDVPF
ncbi:MAG: hypothetical protein H0X27_10755, partial [Caulobacteraceae bacterium]|nr:hypothetical protein [Caulobacteraceae bacterium]